jgi:hypothetical protein
VYTMRKMLTTMIFFLYFFALMFVCPASLADAFQIPVRWQLQHILTDTQTHTINTQLRVIQAEDDDFVFDVGAGGVRLAMESVIKVAGTVKHKPGKAEPQISDLIRYTKLTHVKDAEVKESLKRLGATIVCNGIGKEGYKDPGSGTEAVVVLAPADAVRDALVGAGSAMAAGTLVLNFAGSDDLQVLEVLDATEKIVLMLDAATKAKITFNSISSSEFAFGTSALTVVGLPEETSTGGLRGLDKAIACGEIYFRDGKYWTVVEEDINTAVA